LQLDTSDGQLQSEQGAVQVESCLRERAEAKNTTKSMRECGLGISCPLFEDSVQENACNIVWYHLCPDIDTNNVQISFKACPVIQAVR
jgi:hypothetical protein